MTNNKNAKFNSKFQSSNDDIEMYDDSDSTTSFLDDSTDENYMQIESSGTDGSGTDGWITEDEIDVKSTKEQGVLGKRRHTRFNESENINTSESERSEEDEEDEEDKGEFEDFIVEDEELNDDLIKNKSECMKDPKFLDLVSQIHTLDPDLVVMMKTPLRKKDKIRLAELFLILVSQEQFTLEWIEMRDHVKKEFESARRKYSIISKFSDIEQTKFAEEIKRLKQITEVSLKEQIVSLDAPDNTKLSIYKKYREMKMYQESDAEYGKLNSWIKFALSVPYNRMKVIDFPGSINQFLQGVYNKLNEEIYGLENVKEQILLFLNSKLMNPNMSGCSIALIGDAGTGKTMLARCLAKVMDYPFEQISFGGINQPEVLNGHDFTYIGSKPGMFVKKMVNMGHKNGIMYMDEFEKITNPDVSSMLLQITDNTQNTDFVDNYLGDIKIDMSKLWFIYSMNELPQSTPLTDRLFVIKVPGYNLQEKVNILRQFVLPKKCMNIGLNSGDITIDEDTSIYLINIISKAEDKGIRSIEKNVADIINKIAFLVANNNSLPISFKIDDTLSYPVNISRELITKMLISNNENTSHNYMYM